MHQCNLKKKFLDLVFIWFVLLCFPASESFVQRDVDGFGEEEDDDNHLNLIIFFIERALWDCESLEFCLLWFSFLIVGMLCETIPFVSVCCHAT